MLASKSQSTLNLLKNIETNKSSEQTITEDLGAPCESSENPLQDHSTTTPNSSGALKVVLQSPDAASHCYLLNDHLQTPVLRTQKPEEQFSERVPNNTGKRTNSESSGWSPAKKAKSDKEEDPAYRSPDQPSANIDFSSEYREDVDKEKASLVNGDTESSKVYFCKHCDYHDVDIKLLSTHYQNDHPYIRFNTVYIQDPNDQSATFRCLECPVEFLSVADLERHYTENHPEGPNAFTINSSEVCLAFKCFMCPFTINELNELKSHYKENHPTHEVDNSLMYCKYRVTRCQNGPSQLNNCEAPSPERPQVISPESSHTSWEEVKTASSPLNPSSDRKDTTMYHCSRCNFSHKSVVALHVHYQKKHPDELVTIDKIKQSAHVESDKALELMPDESPKSETVEVKSSPQKNTLDSFNETKNKPENSSSFANPKLTPEVTKPHSEPAKTDSSKGRKSFTKCRKEMSTGTDASSSSLPVKLFYCQFCNYSSVQVKSVVGHHCSKHGPITISEVLKYNSMLQNNEAEAADRPSLDFKNRKQVDEWSKKKRRHKEGEVTDAPVREDDPYLCPEKLFYCQNCNYGNISALGVLNHQIRVHQSKSEINMENIVEYSALIREDIEKSKSQAKDPSLSSHLPLPLLHEGEEDIFFCHFCNYRNTTVYQVLRHYLKVHPGFGIRRDEIKRYSSMVVNRMKEAQQDSQTFLGEKEIAKTKTMLGPVSSPSILAAQRPRTLNCHRCAYSTPLVNLLRNHMRRIHKANISASGLLKMYFKRGALQAGHHCHLCVFSHINAAAMHKHYQEQHPKCTLSLDYVTKRLYVGPDARTSRKRKHKAKQLGGFGEVPGSSPSQRSEDRENKMYSSKERPYNSSSGLSPIKNKQDSPDKRVAVPYDAYQAPLEFKKSPGSSHPTVFSEDIKCPFCPAVFQTHLAVNGHCIVQHQDGRVENSDGQKEEAERIQSRMHVFKCPYCTYVNSGYLGLITHCLMMHASFQAKVDSLYVDEAHLHYWAKCVKRKGSDLRLSGYTCKKCPQMYMTIKMLNKHRKDNHNETEESTETKQSSSAPNLSALVKRKQHKIHNNQASVSKASFFDKKMYATVRCQQCSFSCNSKVVLCRHMQLCHKIVSKAQGSLYKCALCSSVFFKRNVLRSHYLRKHGKEAFLKYCSPRYRELYEKPNPTSPGSCESRTTEEEGKKVVYKCPCCPYVNASCHGILTHCQMKHPDFTARGNELQTSKILVGYMVGCTLGKGFNLRGYACKKCPEVHVSLKKLKIHCDKDHSQAKATADPDHSETEKQPEQSSKLGLFSSVNKTTAVSTSETDLSHQSGTPETFPSNPLVHGKKSNYICVICSYVGSCRKYLYCHYRKTHKLDAFATYKLLEQYNKRKRSFPSGREKCERLKCKICPDSDFDSSQELSSHYSTIHSSDQIMDFVVLSQPTKRSTGLYICSLCQKQMNGIRKLCCHLDWHRKMRLENAEATASPVITTTAENRTVTVCRQDEVPLLESIKELAQWNVAPLETFTVPLSPPVSPSKSSDAEQPEVESKKVKLTCKQCGRTFRSRKGLVSHERSHAALAAIKKQTMRSSSSSLNINKYVLFKAGNMHPFQCSLCSYRTTVLGLWRSHFMKNHQDPSETDNQDEESAHTTDEESPSSTEESNILPPLDSDSEITEEMLYLEPRDVQQQLNHFSSKTQTHAVSTRNVEDARLPESCLIHCEFCSFNTEHLSSIRRHYRNRHGKKMFKCEDCSFLTGLRKTLEKHIEMGHSTNQSVRCPFCLYQTKSKNSMIDHIVLHREERVVPIEVRRPKLSHYLRGIVFRCHKCTFTSGSAQNLQSHMKKHDDVKPYKCRLCYFDCAQLSDLEAHLSDKHQVIRNHELVGQVNLDQLEVRAGRMPEEEAVSDMEHNNNNSVDVKTEESDVDCDEVSHRIQAKNLAAYNSGEDTVQVTEASHNQNRQQQAEAAVFSNTRRGHGKDPAEQKDERKSANSQQEDCNCSEKDRQTNDNRGQPKPKDGMDSSMMTIQQSKEKAAEGSSATSGKVAEETRACQLPMKSLKHRKLNMEASIEDDILRHVLLLDEDGSKCKIRKKSDLAVSIKTEPEVEGCPLNEHLLSDEQGSITGANNQKIPVSMEAKSNHTPAHRIRAQAYFTVDRNLLTLGPSCGQNKMSHKKILGVSFRNFKEEQMQNKDNEEARNTGGEMPGLENECVKEEMPPLSGYKEDNQSDCCEQVEDRGEMTSEDDNSGINEAENSHVPQGAGTTEDKQFICKYCGRNLINSSDLELHVTRHGM